MCITSLYECRKHIGQHFQNISSGDKESNKKTYIKYKYILLFAKYLHRFLVADFCIPVFYALKMVIFVPRSARGKKLSPSSVWGTNGGLN